MKPHDLNGQGQDRGDSLSLSSQTSNAPRDTHDAVKSSYTPPLTFLSVASLFTLSHLPQRCKQEQRTQKGHVQFWMEIVGGLLWMHVAP